MRNECNIICDLLPLYAENMVSEDSAEYVEEHLRDCEKCSAELEQIRMPDNIDIEFNAEPIKKIKKKMAVNKLKTIAATAIIVLIAAAAVFAILGEPQYLPYSEQVISLTENSDGSVLIAFSQKVTDYRCYTTVNESDKLIYNIEAWNSPMKKEQDKAFSFTLAPTDDNPLIIYYVQNNGYEDVCLMGEEYIDYAGVITLPRLALGYYVIIAFILFIITFGMWLLFRKRKKAGKMLEKLMLMPASYIVGHIIVAGFGVISYSMTRSFSFIVLISLLVYCGTVLILNVARTRKELKNIMQVQ